MSDMNWLYEWPLHIPYLLPGLWISLTLCLISCAVGYTLGLFLALLSESRLRALRYGSVLIVEVGRGLPILVLMYLAYQGLPSVGILLDPIPAAIAALTWSAAAYSTETIRAGLNAVPKGQFEAGTAASLSRVDIYRFIILPQASRVAIPPLMNLTIIFFQATSLAMLISVTEIMHHAYLYGAMTFEYLSIFIAAAALYLCITLPGAALTAYLERRLSSHTQKKRVHTFSKHFEMSTAN